MPPKEAEWKRKLRENAARAAASRDAAEQAVASQASLPSGWTQAIDPASGRTYYINNGTNETTWDRPTKPSAASRASRKVRGEAVASPILSKKEQSAFEYFVEQ
jgi:hypothetical protein